MQNQNYEFKTKGIEKLFGEYLLNEGREDLKNFYENFRQQFKPAEKKCPSCGEVYPLGNCPEGHPLNLEYYGKVVRIVCPECKRYFNRGKCDNCGAELEYFLIGNERTAFRIFSILPLSSENELRNTEFFRKAGDISNILRPLHYLRENMHSLELVTFPKNEHRSYFWKKTQKGQEFEDYFWENMRLFNDELEEEYRRFLDNRIGEQRRKGVKIKRKITEIWEINGMREIKEFEEALLYVK